MTLLVIGGGLAGTAAAYRAVTTGRPCTWLHAGLGASVAACGAWHGPVADGQGAPSLLENEVRHVGQAVFDWSAPAAGVQLATRDGAVSAAFACDGCVLDLSAYAGQSVAVLDVPRTGWDARWTARSLNESAWARGAQVRFEPLAVEVTGLTLSWDATDAELALQLAEEAQFSAIGRELLARIAKALAQVDQSGGSTLSANGVAGRPAAVLCGPWLLQSVQQRAAAEQQLGVACAETLSSVYGLAGERLERARQRWASAQSELLAHACWVERLQVEASGVVAHAGTRNYRGAAAVLATGGLAGGGLLLSDAGELRAQPELQPDPGLVYRGQPWLTPATDTGFDVQAQGEQLKGIGLSALPFPRLAVAGDLLAGNSGTGVEALWSGLRAVDAVAGL